MCIWNIHFVSPSCNKKVTPPRPCDHHLKVTQRTRPTTHTSQHYYAHLLTVKGVMQNRCECQATNWACTGICLSTNFCTTGGQPRFPPRDAVGWYKSNAHNQHEKIPCKKPPKSSHRTTDLLSGHSPNHLPGQRFDLLPDRLERGRGWTLYSGQRRWRSSNSVIHRDRNRCPQVRHTNGALSQPFQFKPHPNNRFRCSIANCQHLQRCHIGGHFLRKWWRLELPQVKRKLARNQEY